jgi:CheY-like chemotaxis protein
MPTARILVAEDEPDLLHMLEVLLGMWGYHVVAARNGAEALERAAPRPDLLLTDLSMPEMDGLELCRRFRARPILRSVPIIVVSALPRLPAGMLGTVEAFFPKPPDLERLRDAIAFYTPED